jgi:hypothetical protein
MFHFEKEIQLFAYLLNGSEHIYWILNLENEVHSIWIIWTSNLQECKGNSIFPMADKACNSFRSRSKKLNFLVRAAQMCQIVRPGPYPPSPKSL